MAKGMYDEGKGNSSWNPQNMDQKKRKNEKSFFIFSF
jgi:hypothetical protein